jgi:hypothetical protein
MHTWRLSDKSLLLKIYRTAWPMVDEEKINFCKLFWAVLFCPLGYLLRLVLWPIDKIIGAIQSRRNPKPVLTYSERMKKEETEYLKRMAKREKVQNSLWYRVANKTIHGIEAFFTKTGPFWAFVGKALWILLLVALAAYVVAIAITETMLFIAVVGAILLIGGIIGLIAFLSQETNFFKKIEAGIKSFGSFLKHGYKSLKYRTCPLIEVYGADPILD